MADAFDAVRRPSLPGARSQPPGPSRLGSASPRPGPGTGDVESLISRARAHALGLEFLLRGAPDSVAVTFGVHAFVVDAARDRLRSAGDRAP